ncbi:hypothetical protein B9T10_01545 [Wohlfahrtiimonas chitiniclastica]|uniref:RloB family protein n=1 Tax=Wohlfahrtiimonas chitiniclastica TaxID=400946 RepID=UPI000B98FB32|nr:RloB family protein [Wohlfahrtiimonas chitiniclastica]OYQ90024.1 hypothetical protein B9T10_01545 [Wohlfahrtiimonas chitiniclastica]
MGSDDLFHKRRRAKKLERTRILKQRDAQPRLLIMCEGQKTETQYFQEIVAAHKLVSANIKILFKGSAPISVVEGAIECYERDPDFDFVYCVFDKDEHATFQKALDRIATYTKIQLRPIVSVRQFEYWFILHFVDSTKPCQSGYEMQKWLETAIERYTGMPYKYQKGASGMYELTNPYLEKAIQRAKRMAQQAFDDKEMYRNPYTNVYELVEHLLSLSKH